MHTLSEYGQLGHEDRKYQYVPRKIDGFSVNAIEIGSVYAGLKQSAAINVEKTELFIWGDSCGGFGEKKDVPTKFEGLESESFGKFLSVELGKSFIFISSEPEEESKENEFVLKGGEEMTVQSDLNDVGKRRAHSVYVQNEKLFGDSDWIPIKLQQKFLSFPFFGSQFVDNLVVNADQNVIELVNSSEIDSIYHSDIIGAQFFVRLDEEEAKKYFFEKIEEISLKIPKGTKAVNIYVQPKNVNSIYFLKHINL